MRFMMSGGVMEDYPYLWYDVRPHPKLGTVEIRACDAQTRVEHTLGLAALIQSTDKELAQHSAAGACWSACASTPRTSDRPTTSRASRTSWRAATAPPGRSSSTRPTTTCAR